MRLLRLLVGAAAVAALVTLPVSSASADGYYRHHDDCWLLALPFCVAGAIVDTAAVIATAPLVVAADVLDPGPGYYRGRRADTEGPWAYYDVPCAADFREHPYHASATDYPPRRPWARGYYGQPPARDNRDSYGSESYGPPGYSGGEAYRQWDNTSYVRNEYRGPYRGEYVYHY